MTTQTPVAIRGAAPPEADTAWQALHAAACAPYRSAGRFAWHFARGKLGRDPVFRGLLERGDVPPQARVVDIGCGQGLFASLLRAADDAQRRSAWPATWPAAPAAASYTGIELMPRDVHRARAALGEGTNTHAVPARFVCGDMCASELQACDVVVILDVLHYVDHAAQQALLQRVHAALRPRGRLLLRVGDASSRQGFAISQWVDRTVTRIRGHRVSPTYGRSLAEWTALLQRIGFSVLSVPMSQGTPFANVLLVADVEPAP
jgi:SAM-dependent methyltransferase